MRRQAPSYRLTFDDAVIVCLRHWDGEIQNRTAAFFDCNSARINEVLKEQTHVGSRQAAIGMRSA